jgi:hypothetical protein
MIVDLTKLPEFKRFSGAHSPPRPEYENMTPAEIEEVLSYNNTKVKIPRAPSVIDRVKSRFGMEINPRYDDRAVRIARLMAQSKHAHNKKLKDQAGDELRKRALDAQMEEDERVAAIHLQRNYDAMRNRVSRAAEAAEERKAQLPHPITAQDIRDAQGNYDYWRVAADKSATTDAFVPHGQTYDVISTQQRDAANLDLEALKARHAAQPQKAQEWFRNAWFNKFDRRNRHRGGKSKRVKSKRNKLTKRRNARK